MCDKILSFPSVCNLMSKKVVEEEEEEVNMLLPVSELGQH